MGNKHLAAARKAKNDEFYTRYEDVAEIVSSYAECFRNKIVYCNCDTEQSNFVKYFRDHFNELGLRDLWYSGYNFANPENRKKLLECDIVVTNPPFSIKVNYMEFIQHKKYIVLLPLLSLTNEHIFNLWAQQPVWISHYYQYYFDGAEKVVNCFVLQNVEKVPPDPIILPYYYTGEPSYIDGTDILFIERCEVIPLEHDGKIAVPVSFAPFLNKKEWVIHYLATGKCGPVVNGKRRFPRFVIERRKQ